MRNCYECGKKLNIFEGYYHPILGKKVIICSKCYDSVEESIEDYQRFIFNQFKIDQEKDIIQIILLKIKQMVHHLGHKV